MINLPHDPTTIGTDVEERSEANVASIIERKAHHLAGSHQLKPKIDSGRRDLLDRIREQERLLKAAYQHFRHSAEEEITLSHAAEWMLDNFYVVQQALRQIREDLPQGYYRQLPKLNTASPLDGFPRVYDLARQIVLHDQCQLEPARLERFVRAYQTVTPLTMGEIWALPIMLRFALLETLTQAVSRLSGGAEDEKIPSALQFSHEVADADLVANCIPSLRTLSSQDWKSFFESVSLVEQTLKGDPVKIYSQMDFKTRDWYRSVVEELAQATGTNEVEIARLAVEMASANLAAESSSSTRNRDDNLWWGLDRPRTGHVGFYLIDAGRQQLETEVGYKASGLKAVRRGILSHPTLSYLGSITFISVFILAGIIAYTLANDGSPWQILGAGLLMLIPAVTIAVNLVNWFITNALPPRILPKLEFEEGIPARCRTAVVIPALLTDADEVDSLISQLELHYLRNPDPELTFALLTDYADAPQEHMPEDEPLVARAKAGIEALNQRYSHRPFYLFHRRRLWNDSENVWMGWERKRGKLHEFNRLLRGDTHTSYTTRVGQLSALSDIRYVITLDADTVLDRDSGNRLVATLAHPLNHAQFDTDTGQVTAGYTVLQPRTEIKPVSANQSLFTRIFAGDAGLDLYTLAVSDVYQDLFGEGIYVGKGIYDIDAFEASLKGRVPENSLLSHDLFEGIHGRVALVTDIILYEDYPPHYLIHVQRTHRWIRGDWQLLPWLWPRIPHMGDGKVPSSFSAIDYWKILDNLRRSLLPPALLLLFLAGWMWLPGSALLWTLIGAVTPAGAFITGTAASLVRLLTGTSWREIRGSIRDGFIRWLLALAFLPYESVLTLDAILITLNRLLITHRRLLQWKTAASTARLFGRDVKLKATRQQMISAVFVSGSLGLLVYFINPFALPVAFPLLLTWLLSPEIAYWISRPSAPPKEELTDEQRQKIRTLARRTWLFFEQFVDPQDNWLPPDHFQESPKGVVAHRTSPTNVGLLLLSTLSAYDLGYIDALEVSIRLRATFDTLKRLERYRGHFLNWINTQSLDSLSPRYVSTVDSGNLAGCFLTLRQGCLTIPKQPVWRWERWQGLLDMVALLTDMVIEAGSDEQQDSAAALKEHMEAMFQRITAVRHKPEQWISLLSQLLDEDFPELDRILFDWIDANGRHLEAEQLRILRRYTERLHHHWQAMQREISLLLPWLFSLNRPPTLFAQSIDDPVLADAWQTLKEALPHSPPLDDVAAICQNGRSRLADLQNLLNDDTGTVHEALEWCRDLESKLWSAETQVQELLTTYEQITHEAEDYFQEMDFSFLFNPQRQVFHIGYNLETGKLDGNYYDLLASEARIASIISIAKGDVPQKHWLHLSRPLSQLQQGQALLSWSGTMFEYLMPPLLMRSYEGTLLHHSVYNAVDYQIAYGQKNGVPWGISESGYYAFDTNRNYQYRAFGAPALGFKRGLAEDLVIAPYAAMLALPLRPRAVLENMAHLTENGLLGRYGFYEAIDYTPARLPLGQEKAIVASYMAHHQGMIMLALANFLEDDIMVQRFHAEPRIQSVEMLLQERIPQQTSVERDDEESLTSVPGDQAGAPITPWEVPLDIPLPQAHYLSNGQYHLLLTSVGSGFSQWQELSLTRWRADTTLDNWGSWLYVQDQETGRLWSAGYQPTAAPAENYKVFFHPHMVEFRRNDQGISLRLEVVVAPDDDVEIRVVTLTNENDRPRRLKLTSYGEVVLAAQGADERHPAFTKLFVQSDYLPDLDALLFRRRPRSAKEQEAYLAHLLVVEQDQPVTGAYESSRADLIGRNRTPRKPIALKNGRQLSGTVGTTLDPVFALAQEVELESHASVKMAFVTLAAETRQAALDLLKRYRQWSTIDRAFTRSQTRSEREARQLGLDTPALKHAQQLLSLLFYPHEARRAEPALLAANQKGQPALWGYGISGDHPILLARIQSEEELSLVQDLLRIHTYWRNRQLKIDLVILNEEEAGYEQIMQGNLFRLIQRTGSDIWLNQRGGIFLLRLDQLGEADVVLINAAARVVIDGSKGSLAEQMVGLDKHPARLPEHVPVLSPAEAEAPMPPLLRPDQPLFDNGFGGFSPAGDEYLIYLRPGRNTPAPWINVIANENFGFLVSETGAGYTWAVNSGENRLSPWQNDPVSDPPGEVLYLRDEETAEVWSPTPQPAPASAPYLVRHGAGYTTFEHHSYGLQQHLHLFTVPDAPMKIVRLRLENKWQRPRRITATYFLEWVLGTTREVTQQYVITEYDRECQAILARNPYNVEFDQRVAFVAASKAPHGLTTDRTEFLGRLGSLSRPAGLRRIGLEGRVGAGFDPCAALQLHVDLAPGASEEIYFMIGQGADRDATRNLIKHYQDAAQVAASWQAVQELWDDVLGTVQVDTPDAAMNLLLNRWLLYQALSCRIWGRSALYQSSGAYGFRDQLQDVMSLLHARPDLTREQILRAARHQFAAGDVLHWWHPPSGRGVRTRIKDDLLWLPYVTAQYVAATSDKSILKETIPFLKGDPLKPEEEERYGHYDSTQEGYSLYEHCLRVLKKGDSAGRNGLPLMGGGDWNDGMNRVGIEGQGESVWLGWFLYATLTEFAELCDQINETEEQAATYRQRAEALRRALEANAWDGSWYRRAYYDDGTPLGSAQNRECQIDAIAQSWGVISKGADPERAEQSIAAVLERLVKWEDRLILLFTPPFNKTVHDPGYIKGYLPGIRENGGQYTHAALWTIWAVAQMGDGDTAEALFRLINPIYRADTPERAALYQVEPYVISADVYSIPPHTGRGGWTWYTGSSGWMYRLGIEAILGLRRERDTLRLEPCIPKGWSGYSVTYRYCGTTYKIDVENPSGVNRGVKQITLDGQLLEDGKIPLSDDGETHRVKVVLGA